MSDIVDLSYIFYTEPVERDHVGDLRRDEGDLPDLVRVGLKDKNFSEILEELNKMYLRCRKQPSRKKRR